MQNDSHKSEHDSVNLLKPNTEHFSSAPGPILEKKPRKRHFGMAFSLAVFGLCLILTGGFIFSSSIARTAEREEGDSLSLFASLKRLVLSDDRAIEGQEDDRVNILLLGIGGAGHDGPELTDTIILGSYKPSTHEMGMISIPRDLTVNIPGYGSRKINNVNALAEQKKDGSGPEETAKIITEILGEPVHYTVKVDFNGFAEMVDALGGVDIYVEKSFTDPKYPLDDAAGSVETLSFTQGWTHMDGATALKYSRSRHGNNGEGTDFARAARQQKVLLAMKDKTLSLGVLLNPSKLSRIMDVIQDNVTTDMTAWEMMQFAKYVPDIKSENIAMHVVDQTTGMLYEANVNGAYVLLPYEKDWSDLRRLADNIFTKEENAGVAITYQPAPVADKISIEVQNGTSKSGLAGETAQLLESSGFTVTAVANAQTQGLSKTVIYDFTGGEKDKELAALKEYLNAEVVMSEQGYLSAKSVVPDKVVKADEFAHLPTSSEPVDFLVILGQNSTNLVLR